MAADSGKIYYLKGLIMIFVFIPFRYYDLKSFMPHISINLHDIRILV